MAYLTALLALLKKNLRLIFRDYGSLAIQVAATFVAVLILFLSQLSFDNDASFNPELREDRTPTEASLNQIPRCIPLEFDNCYTLAYVPKGNAKVEGYVRAVADASGIPWEDEVRSFDDSEALNKFLVAEPNRTQAAYVFEEDNIAALEAGNISFIIQLNHTEQLEFPFGDSQYMQNVVGPAMVHNLNKVIMEDITGKSLDLKMNVGIFPHPDLPGVSDAFSQYGSLLLFGVYFISFVFFLYKIVDEKQRGLRDYMKLSAMQQSQHYLSWGIPMLVSFLLTSLLFILWGVIFRFDFFSKNDFLVYFITLVLFGFALSCWVFVFDVFTRRGEQVAIFAFIWFIFTYLLAGIGGVVYVQDSDGEPLLSGSTPNLLRKLFALMPPTMFTKCISDMANGAATGFGITWDNKGTYTDLFPISTCWRWLFLSSLIALFIAIYLDNVLPTANGTGLSPWYFLTPSYWGCGGASKSAAVKEFNAENSDPEDEVEQHAAPDVSVAESATYDGATEDAAVSRERDFVTSGARDTRPLVVKNVVKKFGKFAAVNDVSWSAPRNSCTALLGPNGSGKSTLIKIISTSLKPTSGDVQIYGLSVKNSQVAIRKTLGICPQFDVYWHLLTAREHIDLFAALKGSTRKECAEEADRRLDEVGLTGAADRRAGSFSGGMQRRLSVANALTGDPSIVLLDECSTGADPVSRRDLWRIIEKAKRNRVILLVTHSMEEAEALSDNILIQTSGKLRVLGTALHLKNKFGAGYRVIAATKSAKHAERIGQVLADHCPGVVADKVAGEENGRPDAVIAEYGLPRHMKDSEMSDVVKTLEARSDELEIERFSVNHTDLATVFKRIAALSKEAVDPLEQGQRDGSSRKKCCC